MATKQEEALAALKQAHADEIEITGLDDGTLIIKVITQKKPSEQTPTKGKWARVAEELSEKAPLTGVGESFLAHTQEFRKSVVLKSPFSGTE